MTKTNYTLITIQKQLELITIQKQLELKIVVNSN